MLYKDFEMDKKQFRQNCGVGHLQSGSYYANLCYDYLCDRHDDQNDAHYLCAHRDDRLCEIFMKIAIAMVLTTIIPAIVTMVKTMFTIKLLVAWVATFFTRMFKISRATVIATIIYTIKMTVTIKATIIIAIL